MSNHHLEKQLDLVINLLETLPQRMCDEMEKRHEIRKAFQHESEIEFYAENHEELDKLLQGLSYKKWTITTRQFQQWKNQRKKENK